MSVSVPAARPWQARSLTLPRARVAPAALAVAGLVVVALAVRAPYVADIPRFTDETREVMIGLQIARGERLPLTNVDPYLGPIWNYLLAGLFLAVGPSLTGARLLAMALGALTVVPTYLLGRSIGGRAVGLLAATMLALSPAHIAVNSHIAWANCLTPLFTTTALWLLHRAVTRDRPRDLIWSGLAFAAGVQTHPTALMMLPGAGLYAAIGRPAWLRTRWPYVAAVGAGLACLNLAINTLRSGSTAIVTTQSIQAQYTPEPLSIATYQDRLGRLLLLLADSLGGVLSETAQLVGPFGSPVVLLMSILVLIGLEHSIRRRDWLPLLSIASLALVLPLVHGRYESLVPKARYVAPLLPICFAVVAHALIRGATFGAGRGWSWQTGAARTLVVVTASAAIVVPQLGLWEYYQQASRSGQTNAALYQLIETIQANRRPGEAVVVDRRVQLAYTLGGGRLLEHMQYAAAVHQWPTQMVSLSRVTPESAPRLSGLLVLSYANLGRVQRIYQLEPVANASGGGLALLVRVDGPMPPTPRDVSPSAVGHPEPFVSRVLMPAALQFAPDGRLFFNEVLAGTVRIAKDGVIQPEPFVTLPVPTGKEQGTLGLALDPRFAVNHWVYVYYSEADASNRSIRNRVVRFTERNGLASEPTVILDNLPINRTRSVNGSHNGGTLRFGPDGALYVSIGEVAARNTVQDPAALNGKILRVNPDGTIPPDNPFPGLLTYALGFRNVWGMAFHPTTGALYVADNGPRGGDELNVVVPGGNYAYPIIEGGRGGTPRFIDPFWESRDDRLGVGGMTFYTGDLFPEYRGDLFFCAFVDGLLRRVRLGGPSLDRVETIDAVATGCNLDVIDGPDGTLYFSDAGTIYRLSR